MIIALLAATGARGDPSSSAELEHGALAQLDSVTLAAKQHSDLNALQVYRQGLVTVLAFLHARPDLFARERPKPARLMTAGQRREVRSTWKALLDYYLALDSIERLHDGFPRLAGEAERARSLKIAYGAYVVKYSFALEFIERAERDPGLASVLNEPLEELGLPASTYDRFKFRYLNLAQAAKFAALSAVYEAQFGRDRSALAEAVKRDAARIWAYGKGRGEWLTARNAVAVVQKAGADAFFPVQAGIAEWMGDTKVARPHRSLISPEQIQALGERLEPGDVMLQRREWYVSNVGLPGFWSHAALYIGTPGERARYFVDPPTQAWVKSRGVASGELEALLKRDFARAYADASTPRADGHAARVIEAISEGVSFTSLEHSADADSIVILRPRLARREKAQAVVRAFVYAGRPYDFNFDFRTDAALVCTELIYKAYEPAADFRGLRLALSEILGRLAIPANAIARQFDEEHGTPRQQFDFIEFLDGVERERRARPASVDAFRASWRRPKWHILIVETEQPGEDFTTNLDNPVPSGTQQ